METLYETINHLSSFDISGLKAPVLCVEPNAEMLREAEKWEGVKSYLGSADDFFSGDHQPKCNKILMNESAHLFPDPLGTFQKAAQYLSADGMMVLIGRGKVTTFPLWKSVREKFGRPEGDDALKAFLEQAGFSIQIRSEIYTAEMTKGEWYDKIRRRIFSALNDFSDEQIEEGLKELDREWFPTKKDSDIVEVNDRLFFYIATKR